jgi:hypothetical protein
VKVTGLILIILGGLMVVVNVLGYIGDREAPPIMTDTEMIAFYIGYNLFLVVGALLLVIGYRLRRKARIKKTKKDLLDNFLSDENGGV